MADLARTRSSDELYAPAVGESPRSLRDVAIFAGILVFLILFPILDQRFGWGLLGAVIPIGIYCLLAMGLNIVVGYAGLLDLGYAAFFAIGAYTVGFLTSPSSVFVRAGVVPPLLQTFWPAMIVAFLVVALFGVLLGAPTLRLRGDYLAIVTLGFGEIVRITLNNADPITRGPNGISSIPDPVVGDWSIGDGFSLGSIAVSGNAIYFYVELALIVLTLATIYRMNDSRIGRAWVAVREDEVAAAAMGINTTVVKLLAFAAGAFFAGSAGAVNAHLITQVSPDSFTFSISVLILSMVVLGGL
ncbi:MAG TPA: hypothetical protein VFY70_01660, partial [Thermomicrobiales bacterium]|nr:hypothetical protein [Thermomicrobiales bacterium]